MNNHERLFQVELRLTSDDDKDLRLLTEHIGEEIKGSTGWHRLSILLLKLDQPGNFIKSCLIKQRMRLKKHIFAI
jgi:hypothetical protein